MGRGFRVAGDCPLALPPSSRHRRIYNSPRPPMSKCSGSGDAMSTWCPNVRQGECRMLPYQLVACTSVALAVVGREVGLPRPPQLHGTFTFIRNVSQSPRVSPGLLSERGKSLIGGCLPSVVSLGIPSQWWGLNSQGRSNEVLPVCRLATRRYIFGFGGVWWRIQLLQQSKEGGHQYIISCARMWYIMSPFADRPIQLLQCGDKSSLLFWMLSA